MWLLRQRYALTDNQLAITTQAFAERWYGGSAEQREELVHKCHASHRANAEHQRSSSELVQQFLNIGRQARPTHRGAVWTPLRC